MDHSYIAIDLKSFYASDSTQLEKLPEDLLNN